MRRRNNSEGPIGNLVGLVLKRLGLGLLTILVVSVLIFFAVELLPGDIAEAVLGMGATEETVAAMREQLGLDERMEPLAREQANDGRDRDLDGVAERKRSEQMPAEVVFRVD